MLHEGSLVIHQVSDTFRFGDSYHVNVVRELVSGHQHANPAAGYPESSERSWPPHLCGGRDQPILNATGTIFAARSKP